MSLGSWIIVLSRCSGPQGNDLVSGFHVGRHWVHSYTEGFSGFRTFGLTSERGILEGVRGSLRPTPKEPRHCVVIGKTW